MHEGPKPLRSRDGFGDKTPDEAVDIL